MKERYKRAGLRRRGEALNKRAGDDHRPVSREEENRERIYKTALVLGAQSLDALLSVFWLLFSVLSGVAGLSDFDEDLPE